jgi:hypothetical protein
MDSDILDVRVELVERPARLYRVGRRDGRQGLWYDDEGRETGIIHSLAEGNAAALPMGPHPVFRADGRRWISTAECLRDLGFWFSRNDMLELIGRGFELEEIEVARYRILHFPGYSHPVYCKEDAIGLHIIDPMSPYEALAA